MKRNKRYYRVVDEKPRNSVSYYGDVGYSGIIAIVVMPKAEFPGYTIRQGLIIGVFSRSQFRRS
jgi:hypothetical protein